jgi:hypothetical protein
MSTDEQPADFDAVRADDRMVDRIVRSIERQEAEELELVLAQWRKAVLGDPGPELVSSDTALAAVHFGRGDLHGLAKRARHRVWWKRLAGLFRRKGKR